MTQTYKDKKIGGVNLDFDVITFPSETVYGKTKK